MRPRISVRRSVRPSIRMSVCPLPFLKNRQKALITAWKHCYCIPNHYGRIYLPARACCLSQKLGNAMMLLAMKIRPVFNLVGTTMHAHVSTVSKMRWIDEYDSALLVCLLGYYLLMYRVSKKNCSIQVKKKWKRKWRLPSRELKIWYMCNNVLVFLFT